MGKKKFGDITTPGEAPEEILKIATGDTLYLRIVNDVFYEWEEMWPTLDTSEGTIRRRYVANDDGSNFTKLMEYKQEADIPKKHEGNWKLKKQYGCFVIIGKPQKVKKAGKVRTKVVWDKDDIQFWTFGIKVYRQLKNLNGDDDLREQAEEKGIDMENISVIEVFSLKLKKEKTGSESFNVDYNLSIHKLYGQVNGISTEELEVKFDEYTAPSKKSEIEGFLERFCGGIAEAESEEDEDDEEEDTSKKKKKSSKKKKVVESDDEDEEDEEEQVVEPDDEEEDDEEEDEIDPDDEEEDEIDPDDEEEEDEPVKKKKGSKKKKSK